MKQIIYILVLITLIACKKEKQTYGVSVNIKAPFYRGYVVVRDESKQIITANLMRDSAASIYLNEIEEGVKLTTILYKDLEDSSAGSGYVNWKYSDKTSNYPFVFDSLQYETQSSLIIK